MSGARIDVPGHATVRSPIAPMYLEPYVRSTQVSQRLRGHVLEVLDEQDDWYRVRGGDEYEGWMHWGFLAPRPNGTRDEYERVSLGCVTAEKEGGQRALPLGARLAETESVIAGEAIERSKLAARFPRTADAIVASAIKLFEGAPYLWGGVTPWGADCSGYVQSIFGLHGVGLPRDAWQQSEVGERVSGLGELRPADLVFFSDREDQRVTHVAIGCGPDRLVHLALGRGGYAVEDLGDSRDPYVAKLHERVLYVRRVLAASP